MGYASRLGRARINARAPAAAGQCDRCGRVFSHSELRFQFDWRGASLQNTRILVCRSCEDVPQEQLRSIVIAPDPVPIQNPRTVDWTAAETDYRTTQGNTVDPVTGLPIPGGDTRITQTGADRVPQQTGEPPPGRNQEPGTDPNAPGNDAPGLPYGNTDVPKTGPLE